MNVAGLSVFDWVLLALLLASTVRALVRGFLLEVCSLLGLTAGVLLAGWNYAALAPRLIAWLAPVIHLCLVAADITAYLLIVSLAVAVAALIGRFLRTSASAVGLGLADRFLGAVFGLARGCLLGVACVLVLTAFDPTGRMARSLAQDSQLLPYFLAGARGVSFVVPATLQQQLADGAIQITQQIKHNPPVWIKPSP